MYGYIYLTTNKINNRKYIGQKKSSKFIGTKYLGSGKILHQAIKEYGRENFTVEMLCECDTKEQLDEMEIYYIALYGAQNSREFYNISKGGTAGAGGPMFKGHHHTDETRKKMSENRSGSRNSNYGNHWTASDELRAKHSVLSSGENNGMYGKKHSDETKRKIGEANRKNKGKIRITNGVENKIVHPCDLDEYLSKGWYRGRTMPVNK